MQLGQTGETRETGGAKPVLAGHLLVQCLIEQGVDTAFGVPGESYLAVLDGFHAHAGRIRFITNRQEGGAAFMAEAHGKLTGRPGVCLVTRGPGATNASIGVHTAFQDSTPMLLLVGDVASDCRDREAFQEVDFFRFFGPLAKRVERVDQAERLPEYVARAFATAVQGRPGPVVLILPEDMLTQTVSVRPLPRVPALAQGCDAQALQALGQRLAQAERPLVVLGGGGWSPAAARDLQHFAERWHLPVCNAFRFQDCFDNSHPLCAGDVGLGINPALAVRVRQSDVLLVVGARLGEATTNGYQLIEAPSPSQCLLQIHSSAEELQRVYRADHALCASMPAAAAGLAALAPPEGCAWSAWTEAAAADHRRNTDPANLNGAGQPIVLPGPIDMAALVHTLQRHLPADAVLTNGAGNFASWLHRFYRYPGLARGFKTQLAPTNGAMGYGVPAGIAAALVTGRTVVTFAGDGDFLMNGQELATASQHGAKTVVILVNNRSYGTIRMHQERDYPNRVSGSALENPDFCALARAYGYQAERIGCSAEFEPALLRALASPVGVVLEVMLDIGVITTRAGLVPPAPPAASPL